MTIKSQKKYRSLEVAVILVFILIWLPYIVVAFHYPNLPTTTQQLKISQRNIIQSKILRNEVTHPRFSKSLGKKDFKFQLNALNFFSASSNLGQVRAVIASFCSMILLS